MNGAYKQLPFRWHGSKIIDDIRPARRIQQMIYDVVKSLHRPWPVKALYDEAVKALSERGLVEIIGLCGCYTMVSMTLNTFEFELPEGRCRRLAGLEMHHVRPPHPIIARHPHRRHVH